MNSMTYEELASMIDEMGYPNAYYQFYEHNVPDLPYVIFYLPNSANFGADNIVYQKGSRLNIELYTSNKSYEDEAKIESILNQYGFFYEKTESFLESENMYEVLYEMEMIINA